MAAAALSTRIAVRANTHRGVAGCSMRFDQPGGPLVAICGLTGGAGTTTLALLLAQQAARHSAAPILLSESQADRAGLASITGHSTPIGLAALARRIADDQTPTETFAELEPRLRLIAAAPGTADDARPDALRALLAQAHDAHGLVIIDCANPSGAAPAVLDAASHIIWVLPATRPGLASGAALLASGVLPPPGRACEVLVATAREPHRAVSVRALRKLAAVRCERLVLMPYSSGLARGELTVDERIAHALTGLAPTLRRTR